MARRRIIQSTSSRAIGCGRRDAIYGHNHLLPLIGKWIADRLHHSLPSLTSSISLIGRDRGRAGVLGVDKSVVFAIAVPHPA